MGRPVSLRVIKILIPLSFFISGVCWATNVALTISPKVSSNSLFVVYQFSQPIDELKFDISGASVRAFWTPLTEGVELCARSAVSTQGQTDRMEFEVRPDDVQFDRVNPGMYALGKGMVLNIGYMIPDPSKFELEVFVDAPGTVLVSDHLLMNLDRHQTTMAVRAGFVYIGPSSSINLKQHVVVVAEEQIGIPIVELISDLYSSAADYYAGFAEVPSHSPRIYLALDNLEKQGSAYRGTVIGNALAVYLEGSDWLQTELTLDHKRKAISRFIRHETFHFFQGERHSSGDDRHRSAWLTEGSAEYFANLLERSEDGYTKNSLEDIALECVMSLIDEPLVQDGAGQKGDAPYVCGRFLLETTALMSKEPDSSIEAIWQAILDPSSSHGSKWTTDEFFDVAQATGTDRSLKDIANLVIETPGIERWAAATRILGKFAPNIDISIPLEVIQGMEATELIFQLITSHCEGPAGFWNNEDSITLDASDCAGGLIDRAEVKDIESHSFGDPAKWLDVFKARCTENKPIRFGLQDGSTMEVDCNAQVIEQ